MASVRRVREWQGMRAFQKCALIEGWGPLLPFLEYPKNFASWGTSWSLTACLGLRLLVLGTSLVLWLLTPQNMPRELLER